jgi:hypothetical protein
VQGYIYMSRDHNTCGIANFAIAVSNDPLPAPIVLPVPALSASAVAFLALALAGLGLIKLRRPQGQ